MPIRPPDGSPSAVRCCHCGEYLFPCFGLRSVWEWDGAAWWHRCGDQDEWRCTKIVQESPIGFTSEMIHAILEGRKLETRRLPGKRDRYAKLRPGDVLYAREAWQLITPVHGPLFGTQGRVHRNAIQWAPCGGPDAKLGTAAVELRDEIPKSRPAYRHRVVYKASHLNGYKFRPGMHMPKWMSRIRLAVTDPTRREPVNVIDDAGALREGTTVAPGQTPVEAFEGLWNSIHPDPGHCFCDGPDVRVICFRRVWPA